MVDLVAAWEPLEGGGLRIERSESLVSIVLPALETVFGDILMSELPNLETLALPALKSVGGLGINELGSLRVLALPKLQAVNVEMTVVGLPMVRELQLPELRTVNTELSLGECPMLTEVVMPELLQCCVDHDTLAIYDCPLLTRVAFPSLTEVGEFDLQGLPKLTEVDLTALQKSPEGLDFEIDVPESARVKLPKQVILEDIQLPDVPSLEGLDAPGSAIRVLLVGDILRAMELEYERHRGNFDR